MPIAPITKSASIYNEIKRKILEGEFSPGSHLVIKQIAQEYGLSDIPVREALKELRAEGLVETIPHIGSRVVGFSPQSIKDMLEMRECLETFAAELAVQRADDSLIQRLEDNYAEAGKALESNNIQRYSELNKAFHRLIIDASGNQSLINTISDLMESEKRMRMVFQIFPEILQDSNKEHQEMIQYVKEKNAEAMRRLMYQHKKRSFDKMRKYFRIQ